MRNSSAAASRKNVFDILSERGFIKQVVFKDELYKKLGEESVAFYVGFDPTADSLHIGHFVQFMAMAHMQRAGHKPFVLIGGGTTAVGDPSGRSDMRSMLSMEEIAKNGKIFENTFREQLQKIVSFDQNKTNCAVIVNNADWLLKLNYVEFLRYIGAHLSVNKMLSAECFKVRMEKGLSFLEFNYMPMQAYDFLYLFQNHGVTLQMGGDDQWSNILAGADLIRRKEAKDAFVMTTPLLLTSTGVKMGKSVAGALWVSPHKTKPYDFYQYWRNIADADVENCFKILTFVELPVIAELCKHKDERMNEAKKILAYEITKLIHGEAAAEEAQKAAEAAFAGGSAENMVTVTIGSEIATVIDLLVAAGAAVSKSNARQLIEGGGVSIDDEAVKNVNAAVPDKKEFILRKGKKTHIRILKS